MAVPDSSHRASAVVSVRTLQRLMLADGTLFPPSCCAVPWGRASALAGVAPEALQGRGCSCKALFTELSLCEVLVSAGVDNVSAGLNGAMRTYRHLFAFGAYPGGVAVHRAPEPGPIRGDWGLLSVLFMRPFAVLSRDRGVRCPQLPSSGSRIVGSSSTCYRVIQVDAHAPFDKGWVVVRRLVHESAYVGVLGRARSRSLGTEGVEALPRWDPSTSYPHWLLNTTCGAPSSWWARG
jgi:hypothetical protein